MLDRSLPEDCLIDLHDLAVVILNELIMSTVSHHAHCRLVEVKRDTDETSIQSVRADCLSPMWSALISKQGKPRTAVFLQKNSADAPPVTLKDFVHPTSFIGPEPAPREVESLFWQTHTACRDLFFANVMLLIVRYLPASTLLRARLMDGREIMCTPRQFVVVTFPIFTKGWHVRIRVPPAGAERTQSINVDHRFGHVVDGPVQYHLPVLGPPPPIPPADGSGSSVKPQFESTNCVVLDLAAAELGIRGLGGEVFVLEQIDDYMARLGEVAVQLPGAKFAGFINPSASEPIEDQVDVVVSRVKVRLDAIILKKDVFCRYCGKEGAKSRCAACKVGYCDQSCQKSAWRYHKVWCGKP